jgi:acetyltransferase-like isoleucine patch superfamily enzyme
VIGAWRGWVNRLRRRLVHVLLYRTVFGEYSGERFLPNTRISPSSCIEHEDRLQLSDHVYIGPFNFIEASGGITLGEGVQISHHVSIVTHSSHRAQRLLGRAFVSWPGEKPGWVAGPVDIGPYCFIGPHSLIEAGSRLGRGCIVRAGSVLRGDYPAFAVIAGNPARVVGDSREGDARCLASRPELRQHHADWAGSGDTDNGSNGAHAEDDGDRVGDPAGDPAAEPDPRRAGSPPP